MINEYNQDLYKTDWRWYEDGYEVTRTSVWTGPGCHNGCGVLHVRQRRQARARSRATPTSPTTRAVCASAASTWSRTSTTTTASSGRSSATAKRAPTSGSASRGTRPLDWHRGRLCQTICDTIRDEYGGIGPEGVVALSGTGRNAMWHGAMVPPRRLRFSPNMSFGFLSADSCYQPRMTANLLAGRRLLDPRQLPSCIPDRYNNAEWVKPEVVIVWANRAPGLESRRIHRVTGSSTLCAWAPSSSWSIRP